MIGFCLFLEYAHCTGQVLPLEYLDTIYDSLQKNGSVNYDALLTGYVGDPKFLLKLAEIVRNIKSINPNCRFCRYYFLSLFFFRLRSRDW